MKISDEARAGIVSLIWLIALAVVCIEASAFTVLVLVFITVIIGMYLKYDHTKEQTKKRLNRYLKHAGEQIERVTRD